MLICSSLLSLTPKVDAHLGVARASFSVSLQPTGKVHYRHLKASERETRGKMACSHFLLRAEQSWLKSEDDTYLARDLRKRLGVCPEPNIGRYKSYSLSVPHSSVTRLRYSIFCNKAKGFKYASISNSGARPRAWSPSQVFQQVLFHPHSSQSSTTPPPLKASASRYLPRFLDA